MQYLLRVPIDFASKPAELLSKWVNRVIESDNHKQSSHIVLSRPKVTNLLLNTTIVPSSVVVDSRIRGEAIAKLSNFHG